MEVKFRKKWPKDIISCEKILTKFCKVIDKELAPSTPVEFLLKDEGKVFYKEKFTELFSQTGYRFDLKPEFSFEWVNRACTGGTRIRLIYKDRNGETRRITI